MCFFDISVEGQAFENAYCSILLMSLSSLFLAHGYQKVGVASPVWISLAIGKAGDLILCKGKRPMCWTESKAGVDSLAGEWDGLKDLSQTFRENCQNAELPKDRDG